MIENNYIQKIIDNYVIEHNYKEHPGQPIKEKREIEEYCILEDIFEIDEVTDEKIAQIVLKGMRGIQQKYGAKINGGSEAQNKGGLIKTNQYREVVKDPVTGNDFLVIRTYSDHQLHIRIIN